MKLLTCLKFRIGLLLAAGSVAAFAGEELPGRALDLKFGDVISCDGGYKDHIQGIDTDGKNIYWSFASTLVKTDARGRLLKTIPLDYHCGDLCWAEGRLYVPYGGGSWNRELKKGEFSKNYIRVYDEELNFLGEHHVPELKYGVGCIAFHDGRFFLGGGQPDNRRDNTIFEYDGNFKLIRKHVIPVQSKLGIQTIKFAAGSWWLGCYGEKNFCVRTDESFQIQKIYPYATTVGLIPVGDVDGDPAFLVAWHIFEKTAKTNHAKAVVLKVTPEAFVRASSAARR